MPGFMNKANEDQKSSVLVSLVKNLLIMYAATVVILLALAFLVTYLDVPDAVVSALVLVITIASIVGTGIFTGKTAGHKGWMHGSAAGVLYMLILYLAGSLIYNTYSFGLNLLSLLAMGALSGAFGGMIGVNTRRKR